MNRAHIAFAIVLTALLGLAGCGERFTVSEFNVTRVGWDTVRVDATWLERSAFGGQKPVDSADVRINLFDSNFDTLYSGQQRTIPVPDRDLGSEEKILVEICASHHDSSICEQQGLTASPKRFSVDHDISYPSTNDYDRGEYGASYKLERLRFDSDDWEQIELPPGFSRYIIASIDSSAGGAVQVPLRRASGRFNLKGLENYRDFRYYLLSDLLDHRAATVRFDFYAANRGESVLVASEKRTVKTKSRQTRELEAGIFMQEASRRIFSNLRTFPIGTEEYSYLDNWSFIKVTNRYVIEMDLSWRSRFIRERWYELKGILEVNEDGSDPTFRIVSGNSRALRRWRDRFTSDTVSMAPLGVKEDSDVSGSDDDEGQPEPPAQRGRIGF